MTITPETIEAIEDLARRAVASDDASLSMLGPDESVLIRTIRQDESLQQVDLEKYLEAPRRNRGTVTIHDPDHFVEYVTRLASTHTTVWANERATSFTAVFNDHQGAYEPGWRDHTALLSLQTDVDWAAWKAADGHLMLQAAFAEFIEDQAHTVVDPDAATMLEIAQTFQARRNASFSQGTRLQSGDVQLAWHEETDAKAGSKGHLDIPAEFTISLVPFVGSPSVRMTARLRYRFPNGQLGIGFKLHRPDLVVQAAFADVSKRISDGLSGHDIPVLLGNVPQLQR